MLDALREAIKTLGYREKKKLAFLSIGQALLSILDLFGVLLVGAIGALGIRGVSGAGKADRVSQLLEFLGLGNLTLTQQISVLGGLATFLLTAKTILSAFLTRKTYDFLSRCCADLTTRLMLEINTQRRDKRNSRSSQEILFAVSEGARIITITMLGAATLLLSDLSLILILCFGLTLLNFQVAIISILYFSFVAFVIYAILQKKILLLGGNVTKRQIQTNQEILEMLTASREIAVSGKTQFYIEGIHSKQSKLLKTVSDYIFIPILGKYFIEASLVFGGLLLGFLEFTLQDPYRAVASVSVFLAAGTRMAPALLRIQSGALVIKGSKGVTKSTFELISDLGEQAIMVSDGSIAQPPEKTDFIPMVQFSDVSFTYFGETKPTIRNVNLEIHSGASVAIVGTSGSGKSTLLDLLLGILEPQVGGIQISGKDPRNAIKTWPGKIGYIPQQVGLFNKSLAENVALGFVPSEIDIKRLNECLETAELSDLTSEFESGIETVIKESGNNISGGQKQRIGIARALYSKPKIVVLDEATSALDVKSESSILRNLRESYPNNTFIFVTHRIALAKACDLVVYLRDGEVIASGSFDEVKTLVSDFERQADLSGL